MKQYADDYLHETILQEADRLWYQRCHVILGCLLAGAAAGFVTYLFTHFAWAWVVSILIAPIWCVAGFGLPKRRSFKIIHLTWRWPRRTGEGLWLIVIGVFAPFYAAFTEKEFEEDD